MCAQLWHQKPWTEVSVFKGVLCNQMLEVKHLIKKKVVLPLGVVFLFFFFLVVKKTHTYMYIMV